MDTENRETEFKSIKNYSCDDPSEEIVRKDKFQDKTLKVKFTETPYLLEQADVVNDANSALDFKTRPCLIKGKASKNQSSCVEKVTEDSISNSNCNSSPHKFRENEISPLFELHTSAGDVVKEDYCASDVKLQLTSNKEKFQSDYIDKIIESVTWKGNSKERSQNKSVFRGNETSTYPDSPEVKFAALPYSTDQAGVIKDESGILDVKTEPSSAKGKPSLKTQSGCIEKATPRGTESSSHNSVFLENVLSPIFNFSNLAEDVVENENCSLAIETVPSSIKGLFSESNAVSFGKRAECAVCNNNNIESLLHSLIFGLSEIPCLFEFRYLTRAFWAIMAAFCVGLLYGFFNSYTNISLFDCVCYVFYLTLYLIFF